jgi:two-component system response regulator HydG
MKNILIIDDDTYMCNLLESFLKQNGYNTETAFSGKNGIKKFNSKSFDLVLCDYRLPDIDGMGVLSYIKEKNNVTPVVIMTAYADIRQAVRLIKSGALDYVTKPIYPEEILQLLNKTLKSESEKKITFSFQKEFVEGESKKIREVLELVKVVAPTDMTVLLEGETGCGKEYLARAIHYNSKRKKNPFIAVDCGSIPKELANSELFGHVKGSFTGAINDKKGYFELATEGTLLLDEIGNLSQENQVKMLRALQEKIIYKVGDGKPIPVNVRLIVATNEQLIDKPGNNYFREDLYHRINEFKIIVPPLRERGNDILIFADHFINMANRELERNIKGYDDAFKKALLNYKWHGNIRELKNVIMRCVLLSKSDTLTTDNLPEIIKYSYTDKAIKGKYDSHGIVELKEASVEAEKEVILNALKETNYNKSKAAKLLNIDRKTLYNKLKQFSIIIPAK